MDRKKQQDKFVENSMTLLEKSIKSQPLGMTKFKVTATL
jgi:hypothetical protein